MLESIAASPRLLPELEPNRVITGWVPFILLLFRRLAGMVALQGEIVYRQMIEADIPSVIGLQGLCFPPPFPEELLWQPSQLSRHLEIFPQGQMVAEFGGQIVGSASACRISEQNWQRHLPWEETLGGYYFDNYDAKGSTLYGADISVHPEHRGKGVGRALYEFRFRVVKELDLVRYGTACRIPDFQQWSRDNAGGTTQEYCIEVVNRKVTDRTLSPLLKYGLAWTGIIENYMEDAESGNCAAILEWYPRKLDI